MTLSLSSIMRFGTDMLRKNKKNHLEVSERIQLLAEEPWKSLSGLKNPALLGTGWIMASVQ